MTQLQFQEGQTILTHHKIMKVKTSSRQHLILKDDCVILLNHELLHVLDGFVSEFYFESRHLPVTHMDTKLTTIVDGPFLLDAGHFDVVEEFRV